MKADALSLAATLNNSEVDYYTIPQYQRPYTWSTEEYETLWNDLTDAFLSYEKSIAENKKPEYYFLGPVVFVKNDKNRSFDIIDGQQRTTTFHILLWNLKRVLTDGTEIARVDQILMFLTREAKLKVSHRDAATYLEIQTLNSKITGDTPMVRAHNYFFNETRSLHNPDNFCKFLREYTQFIVIIADDYNRAWDLFIGLNGKGVPLNPTDLVKAYVCGNTDVGDQIGDVWEHTIHPLGDSSTLFLLFLSRFKSERFITEFGLFKEFSKLYPTKIAAVDLSTFSNIFRLFWLTPIQEIERELPNQIGFNEKAKKYLQLIRYLGRRDITTLVFKFAKCFGIESVFMEDFLSLNSSFEIRMATVGKRSRERKILMEFIDIEFNSNDKDDAINSIRKYYKAEAPDNGQFKEAISWMEYNNGTMRRLLQAYEEGTRGLRSIENFELEHLMPQTGTPYWYGIASTSDLAEYGKIVNNIGNLFVLDRLTNNEVKNKDFLIKRRFYQDEVNGWSIAQTTLDKTSWSPVDIKVRTQAIADWAVRQWAL